MTAAYLFYAPQFRPLTPAGEIMPGAYVQFYVTETTTPTNVYADADLSTPLANPVVADSSGEFPAIYLDPSTTYRAQLYDEDDALIWDIDPLAPPRDVPVGTVTMFFGDATARDAAYPTALWQVCDGTNGSPDLRDRVAMGCSGSLAPGDTGGGSGVTNTSAGGDHDHGGATDPFTLTEAEIPAHRHIGGPSNRLNTFTGSPAAEVQSTPEWVLAVAEGGAQNVNRVYTTETGDDGAHAQDIARSGTHALGAGHRAGERRYGAGRVDARERVA
jgi:hypothetical protein